MHNTTIMAATFKLINFSVVVYLFVYLFRRYVLAWVYAAIAEKKKIVDDLEHTVNVLHAEHESVDRHMQEQDAMHHELMEKLERWNNRVESAQKQYALKAEKQRALLERTAEIRASARVMIQVEKTVFPKVLQTATERLETKYANEQEGHAFLAAMIAQLRKGSV